MENACHFKPKAKYTIKVDEEKGNIINQQEHKRRLYKRNMLVISNPRPNIQSKLMINKEIPSINQIKKKIT